MTEQYAAESTRLTTQLVAGQQAQHFRYPGMLHGKYVVELDDEPPRRREYGQVDMREWLAGFNAGLATPHATHGPSDAPEYVAVREFFTKRTTHDEHRVQIRAAMEQRGLTLTDMGERFGRTRQDFRGLLAFGGRTWPFEQVAQDIMDATGTGWTLQVPPATHGDRIDLSQPGNREPYGLRVLRTLVACQEGGLLQIVEPLDPTRAVWARTWHVRRGQLTPAKGRKAAATTEYRLVAGLVGPWVVGLADAVHGIAPTEITTRITENPTAFVDGLRGRG